MAKYIKELTLDVGHKNMLLMIPAKQYDYDSRFLRVQLTKDGVPFAVENTAMAVIVPTRPDCTTKAFSCEIEDDGRILVPLTYWTVELEGLVSAYISVVDANGRKISTLDFTIIVERSNYNGAEISPDEPQYDIIMQVIASENVRVANEEARISAEAERVNNEKTRVDNEKEREENEETRKSNDNIRKFEFNGMMNDFGNLGGIAVSEEEPTNPRLHAYINPKRGNPISVVTAEDIAQEFGNSEDKVLSQKAIKRIVGEPVITYTTVLPANVSTQVGHWINSDGLTNDKLGNTNYLAVEVKVGGSRYVDLCGYNIGINENYRIFCYDANMVLIDRLDGFTQTTVDGEPYHTLATLSENTEYIRYTQYFSAIYKGYFSQKIGAVKAGTIISQLDDLASLQKNIYESTVVSDSMTKEEFIQVVNTRFEAYANENKYKPYCNITLNDKMTWAEICEYVNKNFRSDVMSTDYTYRVNCERVNKAFESPVFRFIDGKLNAGNTIDFSLNTGFQADEPSAIVSEDGNTLYVYAHLKRIETIDGVNWSEPIDTPLTGGASYIMHNNVNLIDGIYYMIGTNTNVGGDLLLYTSDNGIDFTYRGVLFNDGYEFVEGDIVKAWGNTWLHKDYGSNKMYLYIESQCHKKEGAVDSEPWRIDLVTYTNIFEENDDGTIGDGQSSENNPMLYKPFSEFSSQHQTAGNPQFFVGSDNRPVKVNNKYYMQFHSTHPNIANLCRASSEDLEHWEFDGFMIDNRDTPTDGDGSSGNADACVIEFKNRTYLFYTWDINSTVHLPYIKYMVDDRPLYVLLGLRA